MEPLPDAVWTFPAPKINSCEPSSVAWRSPCWRVNTQWRVSYRWTSWQSDVGFLSWDWTWMSQVLWSEVPPHVDSGLWGALFGSGERNLWTRLPAWICSHMSPCPGYFVSLYFSALPAHTSNSASNSTRMWTIFSPPNLDEKTLPSPFLHLQLCQGPSLLPASSPNELYIKPESSPGRKDSVLILVTVLNVSDMMMSNM